MEIDDDTGLVVLVRAVRDIVVCVLHALRKAGILDRDSCPTSIGKRPRNSQDNVLCII